MLARIIRWFAKHKEAANYEFAKLADSTYLPFCVPVVVAIAAIAP